MGKYYGLFCGLCFLLFTGICEAQTYTNLISFSGDTGATKGDYAIGTLLLSGTNLYGMTTNGGTFGYGNIFRVQTNGSGFTDLVDFTGTSGAAIGKNPWFGSLILSGTTLYGMTANGGIYGLGNIFSVQTNGYGFMDIIDFTGDTGTYIGKSPLGSLVLSGDTLFGMTDNGGILGRGNIFSVQTNGAGFTDLLDFNGYSASNGYGSLIRSGSTLYGMTVFGGTDFRGNIFSIQTNGSGFTDLFDFNITNGGDPKGDLILSGNTLYGMTNGGGAYGDGNIFSIQTNGSGFTVLADFNGINGSVPYGKLLLIGNTLYGMAQTGGVVGYGTIVSVKTNGSSFTKLFDFSGGVSGEFPIGSLIVSGTKLYGVTTEGGAFYKGNIFTFDTAITTSDNAIYSSPKQITVFPDPSSGIFSFQISNNEQGIRNIEVYNVFGEKVFSNSYLPLANGYQLDLRGQPNGVYFYRVLGEDARPGEPFGRGGIEGEGKLVIQK